MPMDNQVKLKENFGRIAKMAGHESGATTQPTSQLLKTMHAREAAAFDEDKWMMQLQDKHKYRDAMIGQTSQL